MPNFFKVLILCLCQTKTNCCADVLQRRLSSNFSGIQRDILTSKPYSKAQLILILIFFFPSIGDFSVTKSGRVASQVSTLEIETGRGRYFLNILMVLQVPIQLTMGCFLSFVPFANLDRVQMRGRTKMSPFLSHYDVDQKGQTQTK